MATAVAQDAAEELSLALGQVSETVTIRPGGKVQEVTVTPFRLRQFAQVLKCVKRLYDGGIIEKKTVTMLRTADSVEEATRGFDMLQMFLGGGDEIINILQIAVSGQVKAHVVDNLDPVDGARLASAVFAVNLDFFYQNRELIQEALAPAVKALESVDEKGLGALGQPPSTDSEGQDTP